MPLPFNPAQFVTPYTAAGQSHIGAGQGFANTMGNLRQQKVSEGYLANQTRQLDTNDKRYAQQELDKARAQLDNALALGNQDEVDLALNNLKAIGARHGYSVAETRSDARLESGVSSDVGEQSAEPLQQTAEEVQEAEEPLPTEAPPPVDTRSEQDEFFRKLASKGKKPGKMTKSAWAQQEFRSNDNIDRALAAGGDLPGSEPETQAPPGPMRNPFTGGIPDPLAAPPERNAFTGGIPTPGGVLPSALPSQDASAPATTQPMRPPGGVLPQAEEAPRAALRGYSINGPDGKPLYAVAPKDIAMRQRQRVAEVFTGLANETQDVDERAMLAQAGAAAQKMVGVVPIDKAVAQGLQLYTDAMRRKNALDVVQANRKPRYVGGGGPTASGFATGQVGTAQRAMTDDAWTAINNTDKHFDITGLNKMDNGLSMASSGLNSTNPASQRGAVQNILKAMSGLTVNAEEKATYQGLAGLAERARNKLAEITGDEMSPQYVAEVKQMLNEWRAEAQKIREIAGQTAENAYRAFAVQAPPEVIDRQAAGIRSFIMSGRVVGAVGSQPPATGDKKPKDKDVSRLY